MPQRITPFLWFDSNAQEAADGRQKQRFEGKQSTKARGREAQRAKKPDLASPLLDAYETIRQDGCTFAVLPDHVLPEVERVVEQHDR